MRTLKKTLCLVLALVMVLGLCAVNAAAFTDDASITYDEAVGVMAAAGVLKGFEDGSFQPATTLTRAQAATMITKMMGFDGVKGTTNFKDTQGHWGESYIAFCVSEGIVAGYGDGTFGPDDTLTGSQWAKMVICAIGYNAAAQGISGDSWEVAVAKMVKSLGLAEGIKGFDGTKPINRETACELGFQGMQQGLVTYTPGITVNGVEIPGQTSDPSATKTLLGNLGIYKEATVGNTVSDDFNRPVKHNWYLDKTAPFTGDGLQATDTVVYTAAKAPAYSFTVAANFTGNSSTTGTSGFAAQLNAALKLTGTSKAVTYTDGNTGSEKIFVNGDPKTAEALKAGDEVEVYLTTGTTTVSDIIVTRWTATQVTKIKALSAAEKAALPAVLADAENKISVRGISSPVIDLLFADFNYAEDDYILIAKNGASKILASQKAETVTGKITKNAATGLTVGGKTYPAAVIADDSAIVDDTANFKDEFTLYLAPNGYYFAIEVVDASVDTSLVYVNYLYTKIVETTYGNAPKYYAQCVDMTGEEVNYETYYASSNYKVSGASGADDLTTGLYTVAVDALGKGVFTAVNAAADSATATSVAAAPGAAVSKLTSTSVGIDTNKGLVYFNANQTVIYLSAKASGDAEGANLKIQVATGKADLTTSNSLIYAERSSVATTNYTAKYIIVKAAQPTDTAGSGILFTTQVGNADGEVTTTAPTLDGKSTAYVHAGWIDGVYTEFIMNTNTAQGAATGKAYTYKVDSVTGLYTLVDATSTQLKAAAKVTNVYNKTVYTNANITDWDLADVEVVNAINPITNPEAAFVPSSVDELSTDDTIAVVYKTVAGAPVPMMVYVTATTRTE